MPVHFSRGLRVCAVSCLKSSLPARPRPEFISPTLIMATTTVLEEPVGVFKAFSADRLRQLVEGSRVRSFEANEAIAHHGAEAAHLGVILSGTVSVSVAG